MRKWALLVAYVIVTILAILYKEPLLAWLQRGETSQIPVMMLLAVFLALFPVVPYGVVAGAMGSKYGPLIGGLINVTGSAVASILVFFLVRYVFAEQGRAYLSRYRRLDQFTRLFERHPFFSVLIGRLIPIIPAVALNLYSAFSRIRAFPYIMATILGKIPVMIVFAIIGEKLFVDRGSLPVVIVIYLLFLALVFYVYREWTRRMRKRES
ncbi:TVP38/TMEM64 family protein [Brevibacillus sp. SYP-B805]|uniref:TVP38/TMEM64 family protein n=1 Tax=Brevibacillus sp. SYP-B805 TaxID=1578199 RepID=UPI0013EAB0CD|nr:VTT domain-containing protein [Brevibacillus sp. SYP-B805]NGQ95929.1 TVP38/TMEM64 family protein [Brevibacillus sp. SYP-B805]